MIRVRQLASGEQRYDVRLRTPTGRDVSRTFDRRRDAERWQRDQLADRDRGLWVDAQLGKQPLSAWYEEWWPSRTELRPSTVARDEAYYRTHVLPIFGDVPLVAIDYESVTPWVAELSASGLAPATVRRCHILLSKLLSGAVKARRIHHNPCSDTDNLPTVEQSEMRIITPAQIAVLADAMYDLAVQRLGRRRARNSRDDHSIHEVAQRFAALVTLAGYGGLRFGELAGLRKEKLDPARRQVRVDASIIEVRGKLVEGRPKTNAGIRSVPLPRSIVETIDVALRHRQESELAFTGADGAPLRAGSFRSRFWNPATRATDLTGLRMHDLRHTAVSLWIAHEATPKQVQVWAGHRSVATVFDRYGHLFPGGEDPIMDALDATAGSSRALQPPRDPKLRQLGSAPGRPPPRPTSYPEPDEHDDRETEHREPRPVDHQVVDSSEDR